MASSVVKTSTGVANNATYLVMVDAHDRIKAYPGYIGRAGSLFRKVFDKWRTYENNLLYARQKRFFHLADMDEHVRSFYGDITDRQFFEMWQGLGSPVYMDSKPLIGSLANKYRLSFLHNGEKEEHAEPLSYCMAAMTCLELSCDIWQEAIKQCVKETGVSKDILKSLFRGFLIRDIADLWNKALVTLEPGISSHKLSTYDEENIALGIRQLQNKWTHPALVFDAASSAITDFKEIFRTKGEFVNAVSDLNELKENAIAELERQKQEAMLDKLDKDISKK